MAEKLRKYNKDFTQNARSTPGLHELLVSCPLEAVQKAGEAVKAQVGGYVCLETVQINLAA
jgi:hypothetical protein